jgi:hypothetical protein
VQKDFHFYVTYALAVRTGFTRQDARTIAWANEYTDEQTTEEIYEIQTQCPKLDSWDDPQIQLTVLVPFHFIPGDDGHWPWKTTPDSTRARRLTASAEASGDLCRLGIALHALQDTFSHQGFSGWRENRNSCYPWYYLRSSLPNVGHAEMMAVPDMVDRVWYDPRTNERINNRTRAMQAARATFDSLQRFAGNGHGKWGEIKRELTAVFREPEYDERKKLLKTLSTNEAIRYSRVNKRHGPALKAGFIQTASDHLSVALGSLEGLPRSSPPEDD